jgi:pSer/pThr/pTyr-binding forkhead associated (FHA) protein
VDPDEPFCYVLHFIEGKYEGGRFVLDPTKETIIGRNPNLDIVLVEDLVSRRHAKILFLEDGIYIQDLNSTNGTFVNGERIGYTKIEEGDRILIGSSIMKLSKEKKEEEEEYPKTIVQELSKTSETERQKLISGYIEEIPLPDLLQLLSGGNKNGILEIKSGEKKGKIYFEKGKIQAALIDGLEDAPKKAIYRMLSWTKGIFEFSQTKKEEAPPSHKIEESIEEILLEGLRQLDELNQIKLELTALSNSLRLAKPLKPSLSALSSEELEILQAVHNYESLETILNKNPRFDLEIYQILLKLIKQGYIISEK